MKLELAICARCYATVPSHRVDFRWKAYSRIPQEPCIICGRETADRVTISTDFFVCRDILPMILNGLALVGKALQLPHPSEPNCAPHTVFLGEAIEHDEEEDN